LIPIQTLVIGRSPLCHSRTELLVASLKLETENQTQEVPRNSVNNYFRFLFLSLHFSDPNFAVVPGTVSHIYFTDNPRCFAGDTWGKRYPRRASSPP